MSHLAFLILNGGLDFLASLAAFVVWHHFDLEGKWKARKTAVWAGEPEEVDDPQHPEHLKFEDYGYP
jgi:hypothetical protein